MIQAGSAIVEGTGTPAGAEAARRAASGLERPRFAFVFVSGHDPDELGAVLTGVRDVLGEDAVLAGCTGGGVVGTGLEVEGEPAVSLVAVAADRALSIEPVFSRLTGEGARDADALAAGLAGKVHGAIDRAALVLLADPFGFDAKPLLARLRESHSKLAVVGGLAAGRGEDMPVFAGDSFGTHAVSGALLSGPGLRATVAVAQGCRPLDKAGRVTRAEKNLVFEVDGAPAIERLKEAVEGARGGALFCGLGLDALRVPAGSGDYLARNILGVDPKTGAVAIAEVVPPGATVCFLVRDAEAAREDLAARVHELRAAFAKKPPAFGLYFDCLGRGAGLYGEPGVDARIIHEELGEFPLAGFFGNGELAPFLGTNLLHNYTGALALFGEA